MLLELKNEKDRQSTFRERRVVNNNIVEFVNVY